MTKFQYVSIMVVVLGVSFGFIMNSDPGDEAQTKGSTDAGIATAYSVSVVTATRQNITSTFSLTGTIEANNDVFVLSETQGRVVKVNAEVGDYKKAGSVLVEVDSELKEAAFKTASMTYEKAKKDVERYEALFKEGSISDSQIEQARWSFQNAEAQYIVARRQLNDTKITTPISGIVTARNVNVGSMVQGAPQTTVVANVVDISKLKVKINVAEMDVFKLKVGDKVQVTTDIYPNAQFDGRIATISAKGDDAHTFPVEIRMENSTKYPLKAGMFGRVHFSITNDRNHIVVPREAVVGSLRNASVYVVVKDVAKLQKVNIGREIGTDVEIIAGVKEGDRIVVNGQNNLKDNAAVVIR